MVNTCQTHVKLLNACWSANQIMLQGKGIHWVTAYRTIINHLHKMKAFLAHFTKWLHIEKIPSEKVIFIKQRKWMTRNHNLNQLCLLTTKNHCFRNKSVTFMILYENEIDHFKSDHAICFCYLGFTNRRDLVISNYNLRRTEVKQTKTVLITVQTLVKSENQNPLKDTFTWTSIPQPEK